LDFWEGADVHLTCAQRRPLILLLASLGIHLLVAGSDILP